MRSIVRTITESMSISQTRDRLRLLLKTITESVSINTAITYMRGRIYTITETEKIKRLQSGTIVFQDGIFQEDTYQLGLDETVRLRGLARIINETLSISQVRARLRLLRRVVDETIQVTQARARLRTLRRIITESLQIIDTVSYIRGRYY